MTLAVHTYQNHLNPLSDKGYICIVYLSHWPSFPPQTTTRSFNFAALAACLGNGKGGARQTLLIPMASTDLKCFVA